MDLGRQLFGGLMKVIAHKHTAVQTIYDIYTLLVLFTEEPDHFQFSSYAYSYHAIVEIKAQTHSRFALLSKNTLSYPPYSR